MTDGIGTTALGGPFSLAAHHHETDEQTFVKITEEVAQLMAEQALSVDYAASELCYNAFMLPAYRSTLAALDLAGGMHVLDVGCGPDGLFPLLGEIARRRFGASDARFILPLAALAGAVLFAVL